MRENVELIKLINVLRTRIKEVKYNSGNMNTDDRGKENKNVNIDERGE